MKKIALIMDGWKRYFTFAWPAGILQRIHESNEEVNLYIFNSSGDWSRDRDYNIGEYNIYRLPDLNAFDGIILDLNNIGYPDIREEVIGRAKAAGVPVISIANEIEDFYYVGIHNYAAMQEMITHLYTRHNCRNFWFVMGPEDNYESQQRVQAVKDFLREKQISGSVSDFYYESFEYQCGVHGFEKMISSHGTKPDAIICGNDNIAVGVCEAAAQHGYRIPEDFCVTGFDNFDKAGYYLPHITTVGHIREEVGYRCADTFLRLWAGEDVPKFNYTDTECIYWESCGCRPDIILDERIHLKNQIMYGIETGEFDEEVLSLEYELMKCKTVKDMMYCIPQCIPSMKCDVMYLILDHHMNDFKNQTDFYSHQLIEDEEFHIYGYPEKMNVEFAFEGGRMLDTDHMEIEQIFPLFDHPDGGRDFLFLPLHFRNRTVGYFVIRNAVYLMEKQYLFQVVNSLTTAMENLHKKEKLEYMNQVLAELYIKDSMTSMYNRRGYQKLAGHYFEEKHGKKESIMILFFDLDRLKDINDSLGHEYGDFAIISTAKAIMNHSGKEAIPARTGGDEFILIQEAMEEAEIEKLKNDIRSELEQLTVKMNLPFTLSISIGTVVTDPKMDKTLDDYVREADEIMYREKMEKKVNR